MITLSKFKSFSIEKGKRILKIVGIKGAMTAKECYPFGFDSSPIENTTAIYTDTSNKDESVILGYINKNQLASLGESRMFSVDEDGAVKAFAWMRSDGSMELNGADFTAVRYSPLNTGLQTEKDLINAEFAKIATAITTLGGAYIVGPVSIDISNSESETIKIK